MRALLITGSPNARSSTTALASVAADALRAAGVEIEILDLAGYGLSPVPGPETAAKAAGLREGVASADAVVLASPVYHAGYSAVLKTALDHLPDGSFDDKAVAVLAHGSGPRSGNVVCEQLRTVAKALGGWLIPTQVASCPDDFVTTATGGIAPADDIARRCEQVAAELIRCAHMLRGTVTL
ncbi:NADPH-dependent FMN reductase [Streptacidiphilus anmyonensis]|uniref:NADPH-dependent FMN reductase n=1 Tax=Streptacidiphilus anmyonensis TaxID=405782 RepID=UPI00069352E1|nr:NAD(P)H-dependent oxidoreductase [Streptacidiphilus anmyonensis]